MVYSDNPAFDDAEDAANNQHVAMWEDAYAAGQVAESNVALRTVHAQAGGLSLSENDAAVAVLAYLDADTDGDLDPYATTATAATHVFGPAGTATPASLQALQAVLPLPVPATSWTAGQYVTLADSSQAHWTAASVPATTGEADDEEYTSTAHGLSAGDPVIFTAITGGAGTAANTVYVVATVPDANTFTLETPAGVAVAITTDMTAATTITGTWTAGPVPA